ncbi:TetR/AcrR family transcriptional regulator [Parachitinimonas caeni]|uniref:TetR/AcrR family transcriptional regulator n=1 Tax=Parachitinimonas caeni TaxID=3031301 RepID=A0ABT7DSF9_9NEIS|nr:TetR/AcrR family transcriptional regulator [Parachitinimonas caeni]MDK2123006.1 TetR/AcrR family transcriptional regulator [Parachitinimonas caeni]
MEKIATRAKGRPRTFDRNQALQAALRLFWQHGYEGCSIAMLTESMRINAPSLYAAFISKQCLYREVLNLYLRTQSDFIGRTLADTTSARLAIRNLLLTSTTRFTQPEMPAGCMVASGALRCGNEHHEIQQETADLRRTTRDALRHRLELAVMDGEIAPSTDTLALSNFFATVVQGLSVMAIDGASKAQLGQVVELAMGAWPRNGMLA